jgi:hypothetical protein
MKWLQIKGRAALSFLADLGGALVFVSLAAGLVAAAISGAILTAWTAFPQPYFTLLVVGVAFLVIGLVVHFLRGPLSPPPPKAPIAPAARNPYSDAAALQRRHDEKAKEEADQQAAAGLRRATRRIREELLDNKHAVERIPLDREALLALNFQSWRSEKTVLLDQDDSRPHETASAAYRELSGLLRGRIEDNVVDGSPMVVGNPPSGVDLDSAKRAIDEAVSALAGD